MTNNVIELQFWKKWIQSPWVDIVDKWSSNVHRVIDMPPTWEQETIATLKKEKRSYIDFFIKLIEIKKVAIYSKESDITTDSIMIVSEESTWASWEIWVDTFMRYLKFPEHFDTENELSSYMIHFLDSRWITVSLSVDDTDIDPPQELISLEAIWEFYPENIPSVQRIDNKLYDSYEVATNLENPIEWYLTDSDYFTNSETLPLLYMMLDVVQQSTHNGVIPPDSMSVEISKYEKHKLITIRLTFRELCELVDEAIVRKFPLLANYSDPITRRNIVYNTHIVDRKIQFADDELED